MKSIFLLIALLPFSSFGKESTPLPNDPHFAPYELIPAPSAGPLLLEKGDLLAICGDSITEQKRYSLIIESYLTACMPELEVTCRQFGWSGERAEGFLPRLENDVLRFQPDVATTCYGMNDFRYVPYDENIAASYRKTQTAVVEAFLKSGCDVVLGSPGIIDSVPHWVKDAAGTRAELNLALARFRNINIEVADQLDVTFADIYRPMLIADWEAKNAHGPDFKVAGKDGVHPEWAGHTIMAYAFLKALGLDGDLGSIIIDGDAAQATGGHRVESFADGRIVVQSSRLVFAPGPGDEADDDTILAGIALVPFDTELNRFILKSPAAADGTYRVTWGETSRDYPAEDLRQGINLAADFPANPMVAPFKKVMDIAAAKQAYETRQMKALMHGPEGRADMEATVALTEKVHANLARTLKDSLQPVEHVIEIRPLP